MATRKKNYHKKIEIIFDLQSIEGLEALKELSDEVSSWCTYDCYYYDCGIPCPDDHPCNIQLGKLVERLQKMIEFEEERYIDFETEL